MVANEEQIHPVWTISEEETLLQIRSALEQTWSEFSNTDAGVDVGFAKRFHQRLNRVPAS